MRHSSEAERIPPSLKPLPQWVVWRYEERENKKTKVPYAPGGTLRRAKANDPATWGALEESLTALKTHGMEGVGFVLTPGIVGIDLDWKGHPSSEGGVPLEAQTIVDRLQSYTEWSPSGRGCHILLRGQLPPGVGHRKTLAPGVELEVYDRNRYFTVTGKRWEGYPQDVEDRQAELQALLQELFPPKVHPLQVTGKALGPTRLPAKPVSPLATPSGRALPVRAGMADGPSLRLAALLDAYAEGVRTARQGTRHNTLIGYARAAGGLVPHGLAPQEAEEVLVAAALEAGLPEAEARAAVRWGLEVGRAHPINLGESYQPPTYRGRVYKRLRGWV